jgi:hypothetical protein
VAFVSAINESTARCFESLRETALDRRQSARALLRAVFVYYFEEIGLSRSAPLALASLSSLCFSKEEPRAADTG